MKDFEHVSLYRKWRSQRFSDVVGQDHICRTLKNALRNNKLMSHAYLFCGPKGTGKTSVARIFAKGLNCLNRDNPADEPCNHCSNCVRITEGSSLDVMEIDAASHTSVEMVREHIIDRVNFSPVECKFKIYIIDEVHKLSNSSFNALLKTLEEPPSHVVFILATTHPHELLPTILSRCQRFDFRRISQQDIMRRLRLISQEEGYSIEEGALAILTQASEGSLRDSIVMLEQSVSFSEGDVTTENVISLLGLTDESVLFNYSQLIGEGKVPLVLQLVNEVIREGKDVLQLVRDLIEHYRRLVLVRICKDAHLILEIPVDMYDRLKQNAEIYETGDLLRIVKLLTDLYIELREGANERVLLEVTLIKMASKRLDPSMTALKQRLDSLEKRIFEKKIEMREKSEHIDCEEKKPDETEASSAVNESEVKKAVELSETKDHDRGLWDLWPRILQAIKNEKMPLYAVLVDTKPRMPQDGTIILEVKKGFNFHKEQVENSKKFIANIISQFLHKPVIVQAEFAAEADDKNELYNVDYEGDHRKFVKDAMNIFGGRVISD